MKDYILRTGATVVIMSMVIAITVIGERLVTGPLYVSGLDDLLSQGIVTKGTGTEEDPYLIENLIIDGSTADYGLVIENINAYLVISNCEVTNVLAPKAQGGIVIRGCSNVTIRGCNIHNNRLGIHLSHCNNIRVFNNRISGNTLGLRIDFLSRDNLIIGNYFDNDSNAWACCSNTWNNDDTGNFWSDFSKEQESNSDFYTISPGNQDRMPATCDKWPEKEPISHPPAETKLPRPPQPKTTAAKDTIPPVIELKGSAELHLAVGECFTDPGWIATDDHDGDLSSNVCCSGHVDTSQPGTYVLTYTVTDASNNSAKVSRQVIVIDETPPVIELRGDPQIKISLGEEFKDPGATATDNCDGDISNRITVEGLSGLDVSTPGIYTIRYTVADKAGNRASTQRSIIVGWPNPIKSGGVNATLDALNVDTRPAAAHIKVIYDNGSAPKDLQLQIGRIVHALALTITHLTDASVAEFTVTDPEGELAKLAIRLGDSLKGENSPAVWLFKSLKVFSFRKGSWLDFTRPPLTREEAEQRVETALDIPELSDFSIYIRATSITTLEGDASFNVELSSRLMADEDGYFPALQRIRDITATMELLTVLAIMGNCREIEVDLLADFYGLLYKNILIPTDSLNTAVQEGKITVSDMSQYWNEAFVHPVLAVH